MHIMYVMINVDASIDRFVSINCISMWYQIKIFLKLCLDSNNNIMIW